MSHIFFQKRALSSMKVAQISFKNVLCYDKSLAFITQDMTLANRFRSNSGSVLEFCPHVTPEDCKRSTHSRTRCDKLHFIKIIKSYTDGERGIGGGEKIECVTI